MTLADSAALASAGSKRGRTSRRRILPRWWRTSWGGTIALFILTVWVGAALLAPLIAPFDPRATDLTNRLAPPFSTNAAGSLHILGTDELGRDLLSRLIYGSRVSLLVALLAVPISMTLGATLGITAGFIRGFYETVVMRVLDVQLALPFILLALAVLVAVGPGFRNIVLLLGITGWTHYGRILRAETLSLRERDFVLAATMTGAGRVRLVVRHILPSTLPMLVVLVTLQIPQVIVAEAALSFLGLGIQPPSPSWGGMLSEGRLYLLTNWWLPLFPGICITLAALSGNLLGDWLNDCLDPHSKSRSGR